jgi:hypothetical protein
MDEWLTSILKNPPYWWKEEAGRHAYAYAYMEIVEDRRAAHQEWLEKELYSLQRRARREKLNSWRELPDL